MGYLDRDVRKTNLAIVAVLVIAITGSLAWIVLLAGKGSRSSPADTARNVELTVEGVAPKGVAVTLTDDNGSNLLKSDATLPFHRSWATDGSSFYQLQAQVLGGGSGSISCRIGLGNVVVLHHATGTHARVAAVGYARRSGWLAS